ncbi:LysR substrate-binding domain-containing protein [Tepidicaulis sp. LMO-SS28]|uniref:LysR substrate-binding domain-containing protein n=1 Tax=Tepidicaulis sp. LMO-SS28 TaxID=3447455 RepID=UPI003EDEBEC5
MNLRTVDLNLLTIFDAIMAERHMTRAAKRLGMTQPAISNALARLRALTGDPLFVRTGQGMAPTPRAQSLAPAIAQALETIERSLSEEAAFDLAASRTFTLAVGDYCEALYMPALMRRFREAGPDIHLVLHPQAGATLERELKEGTVDLVWDSVPIDRPGFQSEETVADTVVCVLSAGHKRAGETMTRALYTELDHVRLTPSHTYVHEFDQFARRHGVKRRFAAEVPRLLSMLFMVAETDLAATLPGSVAHRFAKELGLVIKPVPLDVQSAPLYQSWHTSRTKDPAHIWLRETLRALAAERAQTSP